MEVICDEKPPLQHIRRKGTKVVAADIQYLETEAVQTSLEVDGSNAFGHQEEKDSYFTHHKTFPLIITKL